MFHLWGPSGIGKTALLELANSIYAPPENIITFAATPISITILSERLSGIGLIIDEKQSTFDDSKISTLIYSLAEGRTRMKATKESDLITNKKFEINVITSGEEPLNEGKGTHTGASRRTVSFYLNKIFKDNKASVDAHNVCKDCYGLAGEKFINGLIDTYSDNDYEDIRNKYKEIENTLREKLNNSSSIPYIQSVSVIILTDVLVNKFFEFGYSEEDSIELGIKMLSQLEEEKEIDEIERAKEIIEDWIISNDTMFERQSFSNEYSVKEDKKVMIEILDNENSDKRLFQSYGMYQSGVYYIIPQIFNEVLELNKLSPKKVRKGFAEKGYIKIDENNKKYTVDKYYRGGNRRMIAYFLVNDKKVEPEKIKGDSTENVFNYPNDLKYEDIITQTDISKIEDISRIGKENYNE